MLTPCAVTFTQTTPLPANLVVGALASACVCLLGEPDPARTLPVVIGSVSRWSVNEATVTLHCLLERPVIGTQPWAVAALYTGERGLSLLWEGETDRKGRLVDQLRRRARPAVLEAVGLVPLALAHHPLSSPCTINWGDA
jgi:hypothetical protein